MKIIRFNYQGKEAWAILEGDTARVLARDPYRGIKLSAVSIALKKIRLLAPAIPSKVVLVGLNYRDHARELGMPVPKEPVIFLKPPTSVIAPGGEIVYPRGVSRLDYEAELALVIKKTARNIAEKDAAKYILGYTCLNDVTARDLQKKDGQWIRAKSFDTFCPLGPWVETAFDPVAARVAAYLNDTKKQDSSTKNFIFSVPRIVAFISRVMTLLPGDVISTGTPVGVGPMSPGDIISVEIPGIGRLCNRVVRGA